MVVRIRLARFGRVNQPFYNIVVTQARTARNSKPIEVIGTYDPVPRQDPYDATTKPHKDIRLDSLRARYWVGVGAQPTDTPKFRPNGTANTATAAKSLRTPASPAKAAAPAESS
ncbi:ribosomal protein S16 [Colletotrichum scovillei]|uniref:ribosomal protein S16 n=1 Tax=Colletotrichum scovillei TaxID=1209932 RepID=UPI0015C37CAB|nr:ribosomal protein S16 [Colletotrichum scovillei]KAF4780370.1 ribosomal protein S16 [Colletotrichum scovillei]